MQKAMERESGLWVAEKELDEVGQAQCTVCSWSCGNSGRTSNDQDKTDRLAELNTNVQLTTDKYGSVQGKKGLMTITSRSLRWSARVASPGSRNSFLECSVPALGVRLVAPAAPPSSPPPPLHPCPSFSPLPPISASTPSSSLSPFTPWTLSTTVLIVCQITNVSDNRTTDNFALPF